MCDVEIIGREWDDEPALPMVLPGGVLNQLGERHGRLLRVHRELINDMRAPTSEEPGSRKPRGEALNDWDWKCD